MYGAQMLAQELGHPSLPVVLNSPRMATNKKSRRIG
jgi:hypothetical protein